MLAFILRAGRALATSYATSKTLAFPFIAQRPTFRPCRPPRVCVLTNKVNPIPLIQSNILSANLYLYNTFPKLHLSIAKTSGLPLYYTVDCMHVHWKMSPKSWKGQFYNP
eukprot:IDg3659t1